MGEFIINQIDSICFCLNIIILFYCSYLDLKCRTISLKTFRIFAIFTILVNFLEYIFNSINICIFLIMKLILFIFLFFIVFSLFLFKMIGGGDGKIILICFLLFPIDKINLSLILFFFSLFSLIFFLFYLFLLLRNRVINNKYLLDLLIKDIPNYTHFKKVCLKNLFVLRNYSEIKKTKKNKVILNYIAFNFKKMRFQLLCIYKPPLVIIIAISFLYTFFIGF
jgi:Flp pilus assembly protein protease CpaA